MTDAVEQAAHGAYATFITENRGRLAGRRMEDVYAEAFPKMIAAAVRAYHETTGDASSVSE